MPAYEPATNLPRRLPQAGRSPSEPRREDAPTPAQGTLSLAEFWARVDARD